MHYIIGINGFIAKNLYIEMKKKQLDITCISHGDLHKIENLKDSDVIINLCGVNRSDNPDDFVTGNYKFVVGLLQRIKVLGATPYLIHLSSMMVNGFVGCDLDNISSYQKSFIMSKRDAEEYINMHYPREKCCIIRPSNVYGYDCKPYYNNLLVTLIYEKIVGNYSVNHINKNAVRNFISVEALTQQIYSLIESKSTGTYEIVSGNTYSLDKVLELIYPVCIPNQISIDDAEASVTASDPVAKVITSTENFAEKISKLESNTRIYMMLESVVRFEQRTVMTQPRGDMVEVSDLESKRLYMITLSNHSVRGNHYHYRQTEHFYQNFGLALYLLAPAGHPDIILSKIVAPNTLVKIPPMVIHTVVNDFMTNPCQIFITSTQEFIPGQIPDTVYVTII